MIRPKFYIAVFAVSILTIFSCEKDEVEVVTEEPIDTSTTVVVSTYENKIKIIVDLNCGIFSGCHGEGASATAGDFTTFAGLKIDIDNGKVKTQVVDLEAMPVGSNFNPSTDRKVFEDWLLAGAKEN